MEDKRQNNVDVLKPELMDIPSSLKTAIEKSIEVLIDHLIEQDTKLKKEDFKNIEKFLKVRFTAFDLLMAYVDYKQKLQEGKSSGEAFAEAFGSFVGGFAGSSLGLVGAVVVGYLGSKAG